MRPARRLQFGGRLLLELIEPLLACWYVDGLKTAIGLLDVYDALVMIDGCHGARKGGSLCRELRDLLRPAGQTTNPAVPRIAFTPFMYLSPFLPLARG